MSFGRRIAFLVVAVVAAPLAAGATPTGEQLRAGTRILELLRGVAGEYGEAFDATGRLVRPIELEEAGLLLAEARDLVPRLGLDPADVGGIQQAVSDRVAERDVAALTSALASRVTAVTGVALQDLPPQPPSVDRGAALFRDDCATCHGAEGRGDGEESRRLGLEPANFTDAAFMAAETPDDFFNVVTLGRRRSGMPAWGEALSVQERWDVVRYVWTLGQPASEVARGRAVLATGCPRCETVIGDGPTAVARRSDADLAAALDVAAPSALEQVARLAVVSALRARSFDALVGDASAPGAARVEQSAREAFAEVHVLLDEILAARDRGDASAGALATDAYMRFEPYEKRLGAAQPGLVRRIEEGFVRLRQGLRGSGHDTDVRELVAALHADVDRAAAALEPGAGAWVRFVQSAGIILREGFEVVLVVGALVAYVRRSEHPAMVRALYAGSAVGVLASAGTAVALVTVLRLTPWAGEALEGAAMLLAACVLFWVSYWLVSKAEADRWQRYIRGKVQGALTAGSSGTLAAAAFLAVYREGFETILFYQALFAGAPAGDVMVPAGLVAGLLLLAIVYAGLERVGLRVPMGPFFVVTGALLYAMAIVFAGRGVAELQEAGLVPLTPVSWAPRIETLGVFPTVETLLAQAVFVTLLLYAIGVMVVRRSHPAAEAAISTKVVRG